MAVDLHDSAYRAGLAGRPLSAAQMRAAEKDESIADAWREGRSDRPVDQEPVKAKKPTAATGTGGPQTAPPSPRSPSPGRKTKTRTPLHQRPIGRRTSSGHPRKPTITNPTGGRSVSQVGSGIAGGGAGVILGMIAYALVLSVVTNGAKGPGLWFAAKFLNQVPSSSESPAPTPFAQGAGPQGPAGGNQGGRAAAGGKSLTGGSLGGIR